MCVCGGGGEGGGVRVITGKFQTSNVFISVKKHSTTQTASTSQAISKELLNLFTDIKVVFHKEGISEEDRKKYRRYIIAYPLFSQTSGPSGILGSDGKQITA